MVKSGKNRSGKKKLDSPHDGNVVFERLRKEKRRCNRSQR